MKKTLITLLALSGLAFGESLDFNDYTTELSSGVFTAWDFDDYSKKGSSAVKVGGTTGGYSNTPIVTFADGNTTDGYGVIKSGAYGWKDGGINLTAFTISFDLNTTSVGTLLDLRLGSSSHVYLTSSADTNNEIQLTSGEAIVNSGLFAASNPLDWSTITLTKSGSSMSLFVNGAQIGESITVDSSALTALQLGTGLANTGVSITEATIDNLTIWNRALSAPEVQSLIIPEPTTATLSLLALAGLAARRRRK